MGILTNGALFETMGEEEIEALGTGVMWDVVEGMQGKYFIRGVLLQTDCAGAVKGAMVIAGTGRVVII